MYQLGLQRHPSASTLLKLASSPDPTVRSSALQYFLDNFASRYSDFKLHEVSDLAFIPATKSGQSFLAKPHEVTKISAYVFLRDDFMRVPFTGVRVANLGSSWFRGRGFEPRSGCSDEIENRESAADIEAGVFTRIVTPSN